MGEAGSKNARHENVSKEDLEFLLQNTDYSEHDIRELYRGFMQDCPDGKLTPAKFQQMYQIFFKKGNAEQFCDYLFRCFDIDRNGLIDFRELMLAICVTSSGSAVEKLRWVFKLYDTDRDGVVEQSEMTNILYAIHDMVGVSRKKVKVGQDVGNMFALMDTDKDGMLTEKEFLDACMRDEDLANMLAATMDTVAPVLRKISGQK